MKTTIFLILVSPMIFAAEICSKEGREILLKLGLSENKLIQYCKETSTGHSNAKTNKVFDLISGKNDFAEIQEGLNDDSVLGATIHFNFSNGFRSAFCTSYGNTKSGKPTLYCSIEPGNSNILVYSKNKETRIDLLKKRSPNQKKTVIGKIIEKISNDIPVIEID